MGSNNALKPKFETLPSKQHCNFDWRYGLLSAQ